MHLLCISFCIRIVWRFGFFFLPLRSKKQVVMQIAINPDIYRSAQAFATQQGLSLKTVIEDFLVHFARGEKQAADQSVPDIVLSLLGAGEPVQEDDLNGRKAYYQCLEEKHK